jgi:hypothetical protein
MLCKSGAPADWRPSQCCWSCNAWVLSASGTFCLLPLRLVIQWLALLSFFWGVSFH